MVVRRSTSLLALALLGCTGKDRVPCDYEAADEVVALLDAADPHERPRIVRLSMRGVCEGPRLYNSGDDQFGLTEDGETAFARACIVGPDILHTLGPDELDRFYVTCGLARFGVVSRGEYALQPSPHPFAWAHHQWMLDNGLSTNQARAITRAYLLDDRAEVARFHFRPDLRLPAIEGDRDFEGVVVQVSPSGLEVGEEFVAGLDHGVLDPDALALLHDALEEIAVAQQTIAQARGEAWDGGVAIAAGLDTPRSTLSQVILTASRLGYSRFASIGEPHVFDYTTQPITGPINRRD